MNEADVLASTGRRCIQTTHVPGSFYTNTLPVPDGSSGGDLSIKLWRSFRQLSAPLLARALTCISLSLLAFSAISANLFPAPPRSHSLESAQTGLEPSDSKRKDIVAWKRRGWIFT